MSAEKSKRETRLFEVIPPVGPSVLVEALTANSALRIVAGKHYSVKAASPKRVLQLRDANCEVIQARGSNEE